ncbi:MAG TPA: hypothetical protein PK668_23995 [Myxococcota bacterium]|nr:hypothetical protein [Myxococcota bacterium]HRY95325.1 hypothetical protein [Myxococcota bacterium]HSA20779.1 hypothetical protein [Myxococcota bacterium]
MDRDPILPPARLLAGVLLAALLPGCGGSPPPAGARLASAVEVRAEVVVVRQYEGAELRLEARAERLRLDERAGSLEIEGGVQGELAPALLQAAAEDGP